jgi:hypothetical protein
MELLSGWKNSSLDAELRHSWQLRLAKNPRLSNTTFSRLSIATITIPMHYSRIGINVPPRSLSYIRIIVCWQSANGQ